jgi:hypothetical protein
MPWGPLYYLMPASKWLPIYKGAEPWEVITFPPAFDELGRRLAPKPPEGTIIDWWKMPKDTWPLEAPWEPKVFGCWPASKITMSEDLKPSIWPGPHRSPPFGFIKLKMPGEKDTTGLQIPFTNFKIHMRPEAFEAGSIGAGARSRRPAREGGP